MITIKVNKHLKVQKYLNKSIKMFIKIKNEWFSIKLNEYEIELLEYIIKIIIE